MRYVFLPSLRLHIPFSAEFVFLWLLSHGIDFDVTWRHKMIFHDYTLNLWHHADNIRKSNIITLQQKLAFFVCRVIKRHKTSSMTSYRKSFTMFVKSAQHARPCHYIQLDLRRTIIWACAGDRSLNVRFLFRDQIWKLDKKCHRGLLTKFWFFFRYWASASGNCG